MNIGIIGLGLMGGSFGKTLKKAGGHTVYGTDLSPAVMQKAELIKAFDVELTEQNVGELDMLIFAIYPETFEKTAERFLPLLKSGAIVTDFCGTKRGVVSTMRRFAEIYPEIVFIGGHPMAGREFSGIEHSTASLFERASMILVPINADIYALDKAKKFYLSLGFNSVEITTAENHDKMIAYTSQLCHIVSNAFIKNEQAEKHAGYSAGSYRDLTRVARLNPEMWSQLMIENGDKLKSELDEFISNLQKYSAALGASDREELKKLLAEGNERKLSIDSKKTKKD
ncbi:MAG: prephenate dehydrogenase [Clostridia bacterium]|nr:prephenate dehydrogenase [Clostridia bacterium]